MRGAGSRDWAGNPSLTVGARIRGIGDATVRERLPVGVMSTLCQ